MKKETSGMSKLLLKGENQGQVSSLRREVQCVWTECRVFLVPWNG